MTIKPDSGPRGHLLSRPRSEFSRAINFGNADALDLFDSSRCEVRPKKEQLEFVTLTHLDAGVQAVPTVAGIEVQATPGPQTRDHADRRGSWTPRGQERTRNRKASSPRS